VPGTLYKDQKKGRTLRGKSGKHLWFQKQGGKVYYATKNNGGEIGEANAKGFIPCAGILRMFKLNEETAVAPAATAPTGDATTAAAATQAHQVELLTTEGRIVLTFASEDAAGAWMAAVQSETHQRSSSLSDPRRKFTIEDVPMPAASGGSSDCSGGAGAVPPSPRSAGGSNGHDDDDEEEARMSKIGSFIRGKARRKRSASDKEKDKDKNKDGLSVEETERPAAATTSGSSEGRKRPPLPFSFRSRDARATVVVQPHNKEKGESEQGGVQVVSTFSSRNIPIEIMNALAGVNSGGSTLPVPLVPARSSSPTGEATGGSGGEGLSTTPPKDDDGKMRARHMTMATDSPKLVHAVAPHSPATMFAQVVKEGVTYPSSLVPRAPRLASLGNFPHGCFISTN
jgi:hypothetical protein